MRRLLRQGAEEGERRRRAPRYLGLAAALSAAAVLIAACSSTPSATSPSSGGATSNSSSAAVGTPTSPSAPYHPVTDYTAYVGNPKAGPANNKLSPITIGVVNEQNGSLDIAPQWTIGQQIGAKFLNSDAGGIDGHPVDLNYCFIPDQVANATQCGDQMANTKSVDVIDAGAIVVGNEAFENAVQPTKKPITFSVATGVSDASYPYGYIFMGDATHVEAPWATAAKLLGAKTVSILWPSSEGTSGIDITIDALRYVGIDKIYSVSYGPTVTDFTPYLEAAKVGQTDFFINDAGTTAQCSDTYLTMKNLGLHERLGTGVNAPCDTSQVATADGGKLPKDWYYLTANPLQGDRGDPSIPALEKVFDHFGYSQWDADAWVGDSFGQILTTAKWMSEVLQAHKALTPANINAVGKAFTGPVAQGAPSLCCGCYPKAPAVCNDRVSFFKNTVPATAHSPGVMVPLARWVQPPKGFKLPLNLL